MSITTLSQFYFDFDVENESKFLDFDEGGGELTATIQLGSFTPTNIAIAIQTAMNAVGGLTYIVTFNRAARTFTISAGSAFDLLITSGTNASASIFATVGFTGADVTGLTTYDGAVAGILYQPQFRLQSFVPSENMQKSIKATINESGDGTNLEVVKFGTLKLVTMNIKFITDKTQAASSPIEDNSSAVSEARAFLQFITQKKSVEFMVDRDAPTTFEKLILERTPLDSKGLGYKLNELLSMNLPQFFETGIIEFRKIED